MNFLRNFFSYKKDTEFRKLTIFGIKIKKRYATILQLPVINGHLTEILQLESLRVYHSKAFPQFKNINHGKDVVIVGTGPTLAKYIPMPNAIHIGLNRAYQFDKAKMDYLFMQDGTATQTYIDEIDKLDDVVKFYGLLLFNEAYREGVRIPEYHLKSKNSYRYYSYNYNNLEINSNIEAYPLFSHASVSIPAIHFALWTHPKRIYLVGCDCSEAPYWDGEKREEEYLVQSKKINDMIIDGYVKIKEFAKIYYPDVEIISINPVGLKGQFKDVYMGEE